ncbi:hypothetical protein RZS08_66080, partial [Arthrospira platensis SPKY1]|nr:hypothetical protein [Arthrospira platensis SPKY1]
MATHSDIAEATSTMTTLGRRVGDIKVERSIDELARRFDRSHEINMNPLLGNLMNVSAFWMLL